MELRTVEEEDLEFLRDNINRQEIRTYVAHRRPVNLEQERGFLEEVVSSDEGMHLLVCRDGESRGMISVEPHEEEGVGVLGLWIEPESQGEGLGTEATELVIDHAFSELRYHKLIAKVMKSNKPSRKLWERHGFQKEADLRSQVYTGGGYEDVLLYGLLRDEWL
ncbi:MAG: GNAT family N-acetyltransferase [Candidatus Nanohaloarchaea archaeon]